MEELQIQREKLAKAETQLLQHQHKLERLENRVSYYEKGERQRRAHRLITRGAAIESIVPDIKDFSETEFYGLAEQIFSLTQVQELIDNALKKEGD